MSIKGTFHGSDHVEFIMIYEIRRTEITYFLIAMTDLPEALSVQVKVGSLTGSRRLTSDSSKPKCKLRISCEHKKNTLTDEYHCFSCCSNGHHARVS